MRSGLIELLEQADLALASCSGLVDAAELSPLIDSVRAVRTRLSYPEDILVVALAGGTGSGKSSLFNALAGEELVDVGGIRPTTTAAAAAVPISAGGALEGYLDRLGVEQRHPFRHRGICLIDLPDNDSIEVEHRLRVDALLPLVDIVVWVVDPEKYRDARLHDGYLKAMADYSDQFVFVLNQVDRLGPEDVEEVCTDLESALEEDWLEESVIVPVAAAPPVGPPIGIDDLYAALEQKGDDRTVLYDKLLIDVSLACRQLSARAGSGLDFDSRARAALDQAASALALGRPDAATETLTALLDDLAAEVDGVTRSKLAATATEVPAHVQRVFDDLPATHPSVPRSWWRRRRRAIDPPDIAERASSLLAEAVVRPAGAVLARRAVAVASVAELAVAVENMRSGPPR